MDKTKSIYDPCPAGWRVPDGGSNGIWSKASGSSEKFTDVLYDNDKKGMNFCNKFGVASTIWYPASGCRYGSKLENVGGDGYCWSASPSGKHAYILSLSKYGHLDTSNSSSRADGFSVRCIQESK